MTIDQTERPRFYQGQYLGAEDLTAAVDYGRLQQARHSLGGHTWGIGMGLRLVEQPLPSGGTAVDMYIQPGYAWDGFGRTVVMLAPYQILPDMFQSYRCAGASDCAVEVWLAYAEAETQSPRPGFAACDPADRHARVRESFTVVIGPRSPAQQRDPLTIAGRTVTADQSLFAFDSHAPILYDGSVPYQQFPDDGTNPVWLIPLGYVRWQPNIDPSQPCNFITRTDNDKANSALFRRTIGVVVGAVQAAEDSIRLKSRANPYSGVASEDLVWVEGSLRVEGNIRSFGGTLDFRTAAGLSTDSAANDVPLTVSRVEATTRPGTDLQVVIGNKDSGDNRFAVGPIDKGTFLPRFVVKESGDVSWGGSTLVGDQGGSLELGGNNTIPGVGTPYIDFHYSGLTQDYNTRIINDANGRLSLMAPTVSISGSVGVGTTTPMEALDVRGNIKLQDGSLFAPSGIENLRFLRGNVAANGTIESGAGFTVNKSRTGQYELIFSQPFVSVPSCTVTQINRTTPDTVKTTDNAILNDLTVAHAVILTGKQDGTHDDREFSFIVVGPR